MVDMQTVGVLVTAVSVSVAAVYYILTLRTTQRNMKTTLDTRQVQLFMNVYQRFEEPDFQSSFWDIMSWQWRDFDDFMAKYGQEVNPEAWRMLIALGTFFEGLGVLAKRGFIDPAVVDDLMSMFVIVWWEKYEPVYVEMRKLWNTPTVAEHGEYLYDVIHEIWRQQHPGYEKVTLSK
jgi:hypothetical protein